MAILNESIDMNQRPFGDPMESLATRLSHADEPAFAELYGCCADQLYRYLRYCLGDYEQAVDAMQETFLRLVRFRRKLRRVIDVKAYVFRVAQNEARRCSSQRSRQLAPLGDLSMAASPDTNVVHSSLVSEWIRDISGVEDGT